MRPPLTSLKYRENSRETTGFNCSNGQFAIKVLDDKGNELVAIWKVRNLK